jgi:nucleoside-diphosphate-sugar epimerase
VTKTVLVAGASGFVGRRLVKRLIESGFSVIALVRRQNGALAQGRGLTVIEIDRVCDEALLKAVGPAEVDGIFNLAAYGVDPSDRSPVLMQEANVDLAAGLVRLAAHYGAVFVQSGSSAEYAASLSKTLVSEKAALETSKLYGASKAAGGILALATADALQVPMRHLRLFNIYGPGELSHRLIPTLRSYGCAGRRVPLSVGLQSRDFVYVDDCVDGLMRAFARLSNGTAIGAKALNLCTGQATTVRIFAEKVALQMGIRGDQLGFGDIPLRPDDVPFIVGDPTLMAFDLDWQPRYGLDQGIAATLSYPADGI